MCACHGSGALSTHLQLDCSSWGRRHCRALLGSSRNERKQQVRTADFSHLKDLSPFVPRVTPVQKHRGEPGHSRDRHKAHKIT